jgi:hypothetical protein
MEEKDYLLREIEKIGLVMSALRQKLFGGKDNLAITIEKQVENAREMLINEMNFDLDTFLLLNVEKSNQYISNFKGFSIENIELFADTISKIGFSVQVDNSKRYLEKALELYDLCNFISKTYSFEREAKINAIKTLFSPP